LYLIEIYNPFRESSFAGYRAFCGPGPGCNLRCSWCDSEYTFIRRFTNRPEDQVTAEIEKLAPVTLIESRRGTDAAGARTVPLMERLLRGGYELMMETSEKGPLERCGRSA